jgi:hypothetical protein
MNAARSVGDDKAVVGSDDNGSQRAEGSNKHGKAQDAGIKVDKAAGSRGGTGASAKMEEGRNAPNGVKAEAVTTDTCVGRAFWPPTAPCIYPPSGR